MNEPDELLADLFDKVALGGEPACNEILIRLHLLHARYRHG